MTVRGELDRIRKALEQREGYPDPAELKLILDAKVVGLRARTLTQGERAELDALAAEVDAIGGEEGEDDDPEP